MDLSTTSFSIDLPKNDLDVKLFWYVIEIWWTKPHCVNKRSCGADFSDRLASDQLLEDELVFGKSVLSKTFDQEGNLELRRLLPKDVRRFGICHEKLLRDYPSSTALFLPRGICDFKSESGQTFGSANQTFSNSDIGQSDDLVPFSSLTNRTDEMASDIVNNITNGQHVDLKSCHVSSPYAIQFRKDNNGNAYLDLIIERRDGGSSGNWLLEHLMPTLVRWMSGCNCEKPLINSVRLVNLESYNECYNRLKLKYGKHLVQIWPERTDPKKFVYEDIAIAAYLLTLWKEDREQGRCKRMQTFVDLGCGNGLLVYLLTSENHSGYGIDIRRRQIWDLFGSSVPLIERAFEPSDKHLFPDVDWIIGNHSDELTPWIPVIASKSSDKCNFLVIPCCAWDFDGKYQRGTSSTSTYRSYLRYIQFIGEKCGFISENDILKIPSTKRACIVGRRDINMPREIIDKNIRSLINVKHQMEFVDDECWIDNFPQRDTKEPVRNCSTLPKTSTAVIIKKVAEYLLDQKRFIQSPKGNQWNAGGIVPIRQCAGLLDISEMNLLKTQCGGLQTLLKNHRHIFNVDKGEVSLRNLITQAPVNKTSNRFACWFHDNHPDGCPLSASECCYMH